LREKISTDEGGLSQSPPFIFGRATAGYTAAGGKPFAATAVKRMLSA
jgi:hypothetical protein